MIPPYAYECLNLAILPPLENFDVPYQLSEQPGTI